MLNTLAFALPGGWQMLVILAVVLIIFGNRLPGTLGSLGKGILEFRKGLKGEEEDSKGGPPAPTKESKP